MEDRFHLDVNSDLQLSWQVFFKLLYTASQPTCGELKIFFAALNRQNTIQHQPSSLKHLFMRYSSELINFEHMVVSVNMLDQSWLNFDVQMLLNLSTDLSEDQLRHLAVRQMWVWIIKAKKSVYFTRKMPFLVPANSPYLTALKKIYHVAFESVPIQLSILASGAGVLHLRNTPVPDVAELQTIFIKHNRPACLKVPFFCTFLRICENILWSFSELFRAISFNVDIASSFPLPPKDKIVQNWLRSEIAASNKRTRSSQDDRPLSAESVPVSRPAPPQHVFEGTCLQFFCTL